MASASGVPSDIGLSAAGDWAREIRRATVAQMGHGTGARGVIHLVRDARNTLSPNRSSASEAK